MNNHAPPNQNFPVTFRKRIIYTQIMGDENQPFRIGLCMAGAISAGAYTAGVVDYLLEALETWQEHKDNNKPNTPMHRVEIPVIGGSSAGGMTGLLTASAIQQALVPVQQVVGSVMDARPENLLYHSWVETYGKK